MPRKNTEIPFSNRRYWHYFAEVPITSPKKGKSRFQIENIGIIFQKNKKNTEIPFSNEVPITCPEKKTGIPFSIRRYWHYLPEVPITSPKKRKSRFQIEDIGIIFQSHKPKKGGNPFSNTKYWHYFPKFSKQNWPTDHFQIEHIVKQPMGKRKKPFQIEHITKGSVSYLSSPCFSTIIRGIGGPARAKRGILAIMYWISIIRGAPPSKMVMGSIPTGDAVTGPHIRGTLSMREMSL